MNPSEISPPIEHVSALLIRAYGLEGEITPLPGENINYRIKAISGDQFVLKIAGPDLTADVVELEHRMIEHLISSGIGIKLPRLIPNLDQKLETVFDSLAGLSWKARLLEFVPGVPCCQLVSIPDKLLGDLGQTLGRIDLALAHLEDHRAERTHRWDLVNAAQHRSKIALMPDPAHRRLAEWGFHQYAAGAVPHLSALRWSIIHADANDENVMIDGDRVVGLLDFADSLFNPVICELAVACAYAMLDRTNPLEAGALLAAGYHSVNPLKSLEVELLFPLICGRLCSTVAVAAERRRIDPDHPNWFVTEERAWTLLGQLADFEPRAAAERLTAGLGLDEGGSKIVVGPAELLKQRRTRIGSSLSIAYNQPLEIVRGQGQYLFDVKGQPFLDLVNNVCHVGHCHPRVVAAGQRQMAELNTNTRYLYGLLTEYAERLCSTLPEGLDTCFFVNSGSEANELALRLAETYTGRGDWLIHEGAYHGNTTRLVQLSPYKFMGPGGAGRPEKWVHLVPMPDGYRGLHRGQDLSTGEAYGDEVGRVIEQSQRKLAGFLAEPLLGCGGQIIPPQGYLARAIKHVRAAGGLALIDEVQVGFGRVGTHFWAFEQQGVVPDIVTMGKPIGNGHPMAAVVTRHEIAEAFNNGMEFFSTFGGNPVSCAIGLAVLDVIEGEELQTRALELGQRFMSGFRTLQEEHEIIGEARGTGLFMGIELVKDRETLEPAAKEAAELVERMKRRGILLSTDGPLHNVLKLKPPMVLTRDDVDMTLRVLDDEIRSMSQEA